MPDQPTTWIRIIEFISEYIMAIQGGFMAFLVAILRVLYDGKDHGWRVRILDATICAIISAPVGYVLLEIGISTVMTIPVCSFIGLLGVDWLRDTATSYFNRNKPKVKKNEHDKQ